MKRPPPSRSGFTLPEVFIACGLFALVMGGLINSFVVGRRFWYPTSAVMSATEAGDRAMARMVYGVNLATGGLRSAYRNSVTYWSDGNSWSVGFNTNRWILYNGSNDTLSCSYAGLLARNVVSSTGSLGTADFTVQFRIVEILGRSTVTSDYKTTTLFRN